MEFETMIYEQKDGIAVVTLNRPERLNAMNIQWVLDFEAALEKANSDEDARVVVITGAGRAFCAGADFKDADNFLKQASLMMDRSPAHGMRMFSLQLQNVEKPTIAAVNGAATGGGFSLVIACDIRIASDKATFSHMFIRRGILPDSSSSYFLPRLVGMAKACEIVFTGETLDAKQAKECGLVNQVVPHDKLMDTAIEIASTIASYSPIAIKRAKKVLYHGSEADLVSATEYENCMQRSMYDTEDRKEALAAFLEKREPKFTGR